MSAGDRVGLVSYSDNAKFRINLTTTHSDVTTRIGALSPDLYTATRHGLYYSISDLIDHP